MKGKLHVYYDEEGDFLEIHIGKLRKGHFKNLGKGIFERKDDKTNETVGIAIAEFRKRTKDLKEISLSLPVELEMCS